MEPFARVRTNSDHCIDSHALLDADCKASRISDCGSLALFTFPRLQYYHDNNKSCLLLAKAQSLCLGQLAYTIRVVLTALN